MNSLQQKKMLFIKCIRTPNSTNLPPTLLVCYTEAKKATWMSSFAFSDDFKNALESDSDDFRQNVFPVELFFGVGVVVVGIVSVFPAVSVIKRFSSSLLLNK
jgi:hypothetical protein